jgi:hypothetical protein
MAARIFGDVPGIHVGSTFEDRAALAEAGMHRPLQAGIAGTERGGAESRVRHRRIATAPPAPTLSVTAQDAGSCSP